MKFIPGIELNNRYYHEVVAPLLNQFNPDLIYSACLIGYGSDVLGYDNKTSMDHNWGPRMQIFLDSKSISQKNRIEEYFRLNLPKTFLGFPTNFTDPELDGTQSMELVETKPINHFIKVLGIEEYLRSIFRKDLDKLNVIDWLSVPEQRLLEFVSGSVFYDGLHKLIESRKKLKYYPDDIRKIKLAAFWRCISNEEAFIGRAIENDDFLGLKLISTRIINFLMKICFVIKEEYIPYSKWFAIKFKELRLTAVEDLISKIFQENNIKNIENQVAHLYEEVIRLNNKANNLPVIDNKISTFYERPYKVIKARRIVEIMINSIEDNRLRNIDLALICLDNKIDSEDFTETEIMAIIAKEYNKSVNAI